MIQTLLDLAINLARSLVTPMIAGVACGLFVMWQARRNLTKREFLDRLNFSLNILQDGRLKIRTLIEKPCAEVFLNPAITKLVLSSAQQTREEDCLLPIKNHNDYWVCLNALLNEISEKFADGFIKSDMNAATRTETYLMCITCEVAKNIRTRKIRAMMIKKSLLMNFPETDPEVDYPSHTTRIVTLRQLARDYMSGEKDHCFIELELCI